MPPTIGRVVLYVVPANERGNNTDQRLAPAIVTRVFNDRMVNLKVLYDGEATVWKTSVGQDETATFDHTWHWPLRAS